MARSTLGVAATSYLSVWESTDTLEFLERCHAFGAAGIQSPFRGNCDEIRRRTEKLEMYFEAMVALPVGDDTVEFEASLKNAQAAGATALRAACLGTRRYETFKTFDAWQTHVSESHRSLEAALPLLEKYKIPLGLENHKDWTTDEMLAILKRHSSDYLGVCLDFGNNISVLDPPMDAIEKLAPYTVSTHVKDVAAEVYGEGILLSEVILGSGYINLSAAIGRIRQARPQTRMTLEMITRDPLMIPLLTDKYWTTFPEKRAKDLAATLRFVHEHRRAELLPTVSQLTQAELRMKEDRNVTDCLAAWQRMGF